MDVIDFCCCTNGCYTKHVVRTQCTSYFFVVFCGSSCFMSMFMVSTQFNVWMLELCSSCSLLFIRMNMDNDRTHITNLWPGIGHNRCDYVVVRGFRQKNVLFHDNPFSSRTSKEIDSMQFKINKAKRKTFIVLPF